MRRRTRIALIAVFGLFLSGSASDPFVYQDDVEQLARIYSYCLAKAWGRHAPSMESVKSQCAEDRDRILLAFPEELKEKVEQTLNEFESVGGIEKQKPEKPAQSDRPYPRHF